MARIEDIERRLLNWARYLATLSSGGNYARLDLTQPMVDRTGYDSETPIPIAQGEAEETDRAVQALVPEQRAAVAAEYLGSGSRAERARRMGIGLSTLYARVEAAHKVISRWLSDRQRAAQQEAARVRALQPGAQSSTSPPVRSALGEYLEAAMRAREPP